MLNGNELILCKLKNCIALIGIYLLICPSLWGQYKTLLVVGKGSGAEFSTIQSAIEATKAFPDKDIVIYIQKGVYNEKVSIPEWNPRLSLEGESMEETIITYDDHFNGINKGRNSTFYTPTLSVEANDVVLKNLTIANEAGPVGQAIALSLTGDRITILNCKITGHQDTVYCNGENRRHYFENCFISGTTDFIFGSATVWFQNCEIHSKSSSYITAASTPPSVKFGFVFMKCSLTAASEVKNVYLGRPWRAFAKTVFIDCQYLLDLHPDVWDDWNDINNRKTAFYAEYAENGLGNRPDWVHLLSKKQAGKYTINRVLSGWNPTSTK